MLTFYNAIANDGKMKTDYSIIVSMNKIGLPASSSLMAGSVFSQIVNYMVNSEKTAEK